MLTWMRKGKRGDMGWQCELSEYRGEGRLGLWVARGQGGLGAEISLQDLVTMYDGEYRVVVRYRVMYRFPTHVRSKEMSVLNLSRFYRVSYVQTYIAVRIFVTEYERC
jgi:hypothetical protein